MTSPMSPNDVIQAALAALQSNDALQLASLLFGIFFGIGLMLHVVNVVRSVFRDSLTPTPDDQAAIDRLTAIQQEIAQWAESHKHKNDVIAPYADYPDKPKNDIVTIGDDGEIVDFYPHDLTEETIDGNHE